MRKLIVLFALGLTLAWCQQPVMADDHPVEGEPAIVNAPVNALSEAKAIVDVLAPTAEAIYDFEDEEWGYGMSGSLYEFTSNDVHVGRVKAGYLSTSTFYGGVDVDIPAIVARYAKGKLAALDAVMGALSKYGSTGYVAGYDFNDDSFMHGFTLGATLRF